MENDGLLSRPLRPHHSFLSQKNPLPMLTELYASYSLLKRNIVRISDRVASNVKTLRK